MSERTAAQIAQEVAETERALAESGVGQELIRPGEDAEASRNKLRHTQLLAARHAGLLREQADAMEQEMRAELERVRSGLLPVQRVLKELEDGMRTIDLYLGGPESLKRIRDGEAASADTPVTVRQLVLYADEECGLLEELEGEAREAVDDEGNPTGEIIGEGAKWVGIDASDLGVFEDWLLADPRHVDQLLPEPKGVVAIQTKRGNDRDYGGPWQNVTAEEANQKTYFLIRNGEQLYRTTTDFQVERTLVPGSEEWTGLFERTETLRQWDKGYGDPETPQKRVVVLTPGTLDYDRAMEALGEKEKHYFRVALILQGLADRTPIFHPLPAAGLSFLDAAAHREGRVRFVMDAEDDKLIGTGREPFLEWLARLGGELRPGMRVMIERAGARAEGWHLSGGRGYHNPRAFPNHYEDPVPYLRALLVEKNTAGEMVVRYSRTNKRDVGGVWGYGGEYRTPKTRASFRVEPGDDFVLPVDLATAEEMEAYLRSRTDRHLYRKMFPLLKAAIAMKEREAEQELPFREMLKGVLARDVPKGGVPTDGDVGLLVDWFKLGVVKNYRPIVGTQEEMGKAVRQIVPEWERRVRDRGRMVNEELVGRLAEMYGEEDTLAVARKRDGSYVLVVKMEEGPPYVQIVEVGAKGSVRNVKPWQVLRGRSVATWQVVHEGEEWEAWPRDPAELPWTGPEREMLDAMALKSAREAAAQENPSGPRGGGLRREGLIAVNYLRGKDEYRVFVHTPERVNVTYEWKPSKDGMGEERTKRVQSKAVVKLSGEDAVLTMNAKPSRSHRERTRRTVKDSWGHHDEWGRKVVRELAVGQVHPLRTTSWHAERAPWLTAGDPLFLNEALSRRVIQESLEAEAVEDAKRSRSYKVTWIVAPIERVAREAWVEVERSRFVAEIGDPSLWDAEVKLRFSAAGRRASKDARELAPDMPEEVREWLVTFAENWLDGDREVDALEGLSVMEAAVALYGEAGEAPGEAPGEVGALRWPIKDPPQEEEPDVDEDDEALEDYDVEGEIEQVGLPSGEET